MVKRIQAGLLVAREYTWVLACVKVEFRVGRCKEHKSAMALGKRKAKGPNSLVNRCALPVASPMGWERSRSGGDGGGGGGGACGKQSSQRGKVFRWQASQFFSGWFQRAPRNSSFPGQAPWPQHKPYLTYFAQSYRTRECQRRKRGGEFQLGVSPPRHSIDVPLGTIPSGELLPQYRAPFTVR
jgi:hypothetical protein